MKKIKFNIPLITSESISNVKQFLNSRKPLHGPGKNIIRIKKVKTYLVSIIFI